MLVEGSASEEIKMKSFLQFFSGEFSGVSLIEGGNITNNINMIKNISPVLYRII